jgi:hypothetical protein
MKRRLWQPTVGLVALVLGLTLAASTAAAGGNGAQTFTQVDKNVVEVDPGNVNPCNGDVGTLTLTYNDVFHSTINKNGSWFTGTLTGSLSFVPDDSGRPSYAGHFTEWFGDENNLRNGVEHSTFNVEATGSDGSHLKFHDNSQATMNANGVITVSFDHMFCG